MDTVFSLGLFWIVGLIGFVWLLVVAFREHIGWGFAVLLLSPITAIVFTIIHWRAARIPFLMFFVAGVLQATWLFGAFRHMAGDEMVDTLAELSRGELTEEQAANRLALQLAERASKTGHITAQDLEALRREIESQSPQGTPEAESVDEMLQRIVAKLPGEVAPPPTQGGIAAEPVAQDPQPPAPPQAAADVRRKDAATTITVADAHQHIGKSMAVITRNGVRRDGILIRTDPEGLTFQRRILGAGGYMEFRMKNEDIAGLELR